MNFFCPPLHPTGEGIITGHLDKEVNTPHEGRVVLDDERVSHLDLIVPPLSLYPMEVQLILDSMEGHYHRHQTITQPTDDDDVALPPECALLTSGCNSS